MPMPNLLDVQLQSFDKLIETNAAEQWDFGLDRVFGEIFPISDVNEHFTLEYVSTSLGEPKYSVEECIERDMTYAAPLKATLRLIVWERPEEEDMEGLDPQQQAKLKKKKKPIIPIEDRRRQDIIEEEGDLCRLPILTELGRFIVNGS